MDLRILYVEDNAFIRDAVALLLAGEGRAVVACANGEEALDAFERQPFDVVVTDVSLPGMSGADLARRLLASNPSLWVVLSSGYELGNGLDRLGPNVRSLPKPFEPCQLEALVGEICRVLRPSAAR